MSDDQPRVIIDRRRTPEFQNRFSLGQVVIAVPVIGMFVTMLYYASQAGILLATLQSSLARETDQRIASDTLIETRTKGAIDLVTAQLATMLNDRKEEKQAIQDLLHKVDTLAQASSPAKPK